MFVFFSIIIPSYNRAPELQSSIASVLAQSYRNFELIIVDDGSSDNTKDIIKSFPDPRIKYLYQINKGVCAARNTGIRNSRGNYITFLDSDDSAENDWLMNFFLNLESNPTDIVFCDMNLHFPDGRTKLRRALFRYNEKVQNNNGMFMPGSFAIKSELIKSIGGFDENIKFGEFTDIDFTLQKMNITRSFTNKVGINYHPAPNGGGKNQKNKINYVTYILKKHAWIFKKDKNTKRCYLQNAAYASVLLNDFGQARFFYRKAFLVNPLRVENLLKSFLTYSSFLSSVVWKLK